GIAATSHRPGRSGRPFPNPGTRATMFSNPAAPRALRHWVLDLAAAPPFAAHRRTTAAEENDAADHAGAAARGAGTTRLPRAGVSLPGRLGPGHPGARDAGDRGAIRDPDARHARRDGGARRPRSLAHGLGQDPRVRRADRRADR